MPEPGHGLSADVNKRTKKGTKVTQRQATAAIGEAIDGLLITENNIKVIQEALNSGIMKGLEAVGMEVQARAFEYAPYDTGRLRNSIAHVLDNDEPAVYIGSNVEYAAFQELGSHESGYPGANDGEGYLRPAINKNKARIQEAFTTAVQNSMPQG